MEMDSNITSSEDEFDVEALQEAIDGNFLKESYFCKSPSNCVKKGESTNNTCEQKTTKSNLSHNLKLNIFGVSDSFQKHVAGKLDKLLEKDIVFIDNHENLHFSTKGGDSKLKHGIKLLNSSNAITEDEEVSCVENKSSFKHNKRPKNLSIQNDSKLREEQIKEAAVSHNWILSKCDTKAWFVKKEEADFQYKKLSNGTLVEK